MQKKLLTAFGAYAVLAILAGVTLDGKMRLAVWILMAGFAVKTYIAYRANWPED
jgi:hypothetical protein